MMYFKFILASQILNLASLLAVGQTRSCTFEPHPKSVSNGVSDSKGVKKENIDSHQDAHLSPLKSSSDKVANLCADDNVHDQVEATYSQADVSRINSLLREASQLKEKPKSWMLWFGKKFIGVPYVGGTLDRAEEEKLVINTSELDCTTFVEIVTALTRCMSGNGKRDFSDFCRQLQHVRYINGEIAYEKRQHYFTVWISDNVEEGIVTDIQNNPPFTKVQHVSVNWMTTRCMSGNGKRDFSDFCRQLQHVRYINGEIAYEKRQHYFTVWISDNVEEGIVTDIQNNPPFTKVQHVSVNWMTTHQQSYKMLKNNTKRLQGIKALEEQISGKSYRYIPKEQIVDSRLFRNTIHDGDILVMITNKKGLDTTHIGIASWHQDGLHMLNASSIHKKVIDEPMLLRTYMMKHPSQIGIRVCRVVDGAK